MSEYVITKEISKKIYNFFDAYKDYAFANGVWISGFFGSGKSHFLKILSYILLNKENGNKKPLDYFDDKIADNRILADMKRSSDITTDVVLFNIDAESDADRDSAEQHREVWKQINSLLDDLRFAFAEEVLSAIEVRDVLDAGLLQLTLGLTPPMIDQVLVGSVDRSADRLGHLLGVGAAGLVGLAPDHRVLGSPGRRPIGCMDRIHFCSWASGSDNHHRGRHHHHQPGTHHSQHQLGPLPTRSRRHHHSKP